MEILPKIIVFSLSIMFLFRYLNNTTLYRIIDEILSDDNIEPKIKFSYYEKYKIKKYIKSNLPK